MATCVRVEMPQPPVEYLLRLNAREALYILQNLEPRPHALRPGDGLIYAGIHHALTCAGVTP